MHGSVLWAVCTYACTPNSNCAFTIHSGCCDQTRADPFFHLSICSFLWCSAHDLVSTPLVKRRFGNPRLVRERGWAEERWLRCDQVPLCPDGKGGVGRLWLMRDLVLALDDDALFAHYAVGYLSRCYGRWACICRSVWIKSITEKSLTVFLFIFFKYAIMHCSFALNTLYIVLSTCCLEPVADGFWIYYISVK